MPLFIVSITKERPDASESLSTYCLSELEPLVLHGVRRKQQIAPLVASEHT